MAEKNNTHGGKQETGIKTVCPDPGFLFTAVRLCV
jgi:hypothetical protein